MSLWALSGERTPEQQAAMDNTQVDTRDPLKILLFLEERAIDDLHPFDPPTDTRHLNKSERSYINHFIDSRL